MSMVDKKTKVLGQGPKKKSYFIPAVVLVGIIAVGGVFFLNKGGADNAATSGAYNVGQSVNYSGQSIEMSPVTPEIKDGKVSIDLKAVTDAKIVKFELPNQPVTLPNGNKFNTLPVVAYVSPSGKVIGAVSFCEPCSGINFHIANDTLVCNACGTTWALEDLKGIQGGCLQYPPDVLKYEVKDGKIVFDEQALRSWQPRQL